MMDFKALDYKFSIFYGDREFVLVAVKENGSTLQYASDVLKADREIVLEAIRNSRGDALEWASNELKGDREIVLEAVSKYGSNLQYASDKLKADPEIALTALEKIVMFCDNSYCRRNGYFGTTKTLDEHLDIMSEVWQEYIPQKLGVHEGFLKIADKFSEEIRTNER